MGFGYLILFDDEACTIRDNNIGKIMLNVPMAKNKMFPLKVENVENFP